jgi:hypothetical protein
MGGTGGGTGAGGAVAAAAAALTFIYVKRHACVNFSLFCAYPGSVPYIQGATWGSHNGRRRVINPRLNVCIHHGGH